MSFWDHLEELRVDLDGALTLPDGPGLGVDVDEARRGTGAHDRCGILRERWLKNHQMIDV